MNENKVIEEDAPPPETTIIEPTEFQYLVLKIPEHYNILLDGGRGGGKRLAQSNLVLTDSGWKKVGNVTKDDRLVAPDGTYTEILGIYFSKDGPLYRITFDDGAWVEADADHLWTVQDTKYAYQTGWQVKTTAELIDLYDRPNRPWAIPTMSNPAPGQPYEGPDPYACGLLLGDGSMVQNIRNVTLYTPDEFCIEHMEKYHGWHRGIYDGKLRAYATNDKASNIWKDFLGRHKGPNKEIPEFLLLADPATRLACLQGLMDTDGTVEDNGKASFGSTSYRLCKGVQYLVRSLGGKASLTWKNHKQKTTDSLPGYYEVSVKYGDKFCPFRLPRKADRCKPNQIGKNRRIVSIARIEDGPATCFTVAHESQQFVCQGFVVTHNSVCAQFLMIRHAVQYGSKCKILYVRESWESIKQFEDELAGLIWKIFGKSVHRHKTDHIFTWPSGATIQISQLEDEKDYNKFQGKALCDETPIPTPEGWKALKDIRIGDKVFDEKGLPCNVTDIHKVWPERAYRLTFKDGCTIDCCNEHQWITLTTADLKSDGSFPEDWANRPTITTQGIVDTFRHKGNSNHLIPMVEGGHRTITAYEEIAPKPMRCLMVDSPNHMYLCGEGMIPTHNSFTMLVVDEYGARREAKYVWLLVSNMRAPRGVPTQVILLANPGGQQHGHIHYDFIAKAPGWTPFEKDGEMWIHCPSTYKDNPTIDQEAYIRKLRQACGSDEDLFRAWENGDWNIARGAYFAGALDERVHMLGVPDQDGNEKLISTECPFPITSMWLPALGMDWGSGAPCVTYLGIESPGIKGFPKGSIILVDEIAAHEPNDLNVGLNWPPDKLADVLKNDLCRPWKVFPQGVGDDAYGLQDTLLNTLRKQGVYFVRPRKERVAGWQEMRKMLVAAKDRTGEPGLWISARCQYFWKTAPFIQRDPKRPEDIITKNVPDHGLDAARYRILHRGSVAHSGATEGI